MAHVKTGGEVRNRIVENKGIPGSKGGTRRRGERATAKGQLTDKEGCDSEKPRARWAKEVDDDNQPTSFLINRLARGFPGRGRVLAIVWGIA